MRSKPLIASARPATIVLPAGNLNWGICAAAVPQRSEPRYHVRPSINRESILEHRSKAPRRAGAASPFGPGVVGLKGSREDQPAEQLGTAKPALPTSVYESLTGVALTRGNPSGNSTLPLRFSPPGRQLRSQRRGREGGPHPKCPAGIWRPGDSETENLSHPWPPGRAAEGDANLP